ncbi:MAG: hypothetical protein HC915_02080 [Anaerolineae bacterium]|nr:hypothetical protein [Anaerolineae bacterium]
MTKQKTSSRSQTPQTSRPTASQRTSAPSTQSTHNAGAPSSKASAGRKSTRKAVPPAPPPEPTLPAPVKAFLEDPDALRNLGHYLPGWFDEAAAALLIGIGAVMVASTVAATSSGSPDGELSGDVARLLQQGFGNGAVVISLAVLAAGLMILMPKVGVKVRLGWGRFLALEVVFISFQGLLHLLAFEPEAFALAREGGGGGYLGWGISAFFTELLGLPNQVAIGLLSLSLLAGVHWLLQIRRRHYAEAIQWVSSRIQALASRLDPDPPMAVPVASVAPFVEPTEAPPEEHAAPTLAVAETEAPATETNPEEALSEDATPSAPIQPMQPLPANRRPGNSANPGRAIEAPSRRPSIVPRLSEPDPTENPFAPPQAEAAPPAPQRWSAAPPLPPPRPTPAWRHRLPRQNAQNSARLLILTAPC